MPARTLTQLAARLRQEATSNGSAAETDRDLLARFLREQDEAAFEALVRRHDRLVRSAIAKVLADPHDAEDAFQATFLVLVRRARSIDWRAGLGPWLYGVAHRVAVKARDAGRTRARKEAGAKPADPEAPPDLSWREACGLLHAELDALPDRYRLPLLLCYLEGKTRDEAATALGVTPGTVKGRLERGRELLRERLARRGVTLSAGLLAMVASERAGASSPSSVSAVLEVVRGAAPARVAALTREAVMSSILSKLTKSLAVVVGLAVAASVMLAAGRAKPLEEQTPTPRQGKTQPAAKESAKKIEVRGVVIGPDDKPIARAKLFVHQWDKVIPAPQPTAKDDGTFALMLEENTNEYVVASAPGFGIGWAYTHLHPIQPLTIRLTPEEPITGKVVNLEGKPVAGVSLSVVSVRRPGNEKTLNEWLETTRNPNAPAAPLDWLTDWWSQLAAVGLVTPATSDRDGKFEIRGLGRDRVASLRVTSPTVATHEMEVVTRKIERFTAPGRVTGEPDTYHGSSPVVVAAPVPATTGRILDEKTKKPVPGTVLWVEHLSQRNTLIAGLKAVADKDGRFTLPGLPQGNQALGVIVIPPDGTSYHRVRVNVPDDPAERAAFDIKLARGIPATVKFIDKATGKPVAGFLRYGVFEDDNPNVKAVPNVWHDSQWTHSPMMYPNSEEFRIVVFPGKGLLAVRVGGDGQYLTGVGVEPFEKYRSEDQLYGLVSLRNIHPAQWHTFAEIDVPADAKEFTVTIAVERGVTAAGRLVDADGKPVTGVESFGLVNHQAASAAWAKSASDGTFTAVALRPGEKRRVMFVHVERKLAGSAIVVGGAKEPIKVRMGPWGEVTGRLVDADGKPLAGQLWMSWEVVRKSDLALGSSPLCRPGTGGVDAGSDGRFRVTGLIPGLKYRWIASAAKREDVTVPDVVPKAGTLDIGDIVFRDEK